MSEKIFKNLKSIAARLRSENGCPWDKEQTIESLYPLLLDEVEELKAAIDNKDYENLKEELGDIIFNLLLIIQVAEEEKHFKLKEVLSDIEKKIIRRHTWVFGEDKAKNAEEALKIWKQNKRREKDKNI